MKIYKSRLLSSMNTEFYRFKNRTGNGINTNLTAFEKWNIGTDLKMCFIFMCIKFIFVCNDPRAVYHPIKTASIFFIGGF